VASLTHFHILVEFRQLVDVEPQLLERALITYYTDEVPDQSKTGSFPHRYREQGVSPPNGLLPDKRPNSLLKNSFGSSFRGALRHGISLFVGF